MIHQRCRVYEFRHPVHADRIMCIRHITRIDAILSFSYLFDLSYNKAKSYYIRTL